MDERKPLLVGQCWRESFGALDAAEQQAMLVVIRSLPELALSQGLRSTSRVAKALTRIAVASSSCEAGAYTRPLLSSS